MTSTMIVREVANSSKTPSLSGIDGQALCYPASPQFALVR
jgi:hypothetical protein